MQREWFGLTLAGVLWALPGLVSARPVTADEARSAAAAWSARNEHLVEAAAAGSEGAPEAVCDAAGQVLFYLVPAANGAQTLAVAGETRLEPILAVFSGAGTAGGAAMVDILRADVAGRLAALGAEAVPLLKATASESERASPEETRWADLLGERAAGGLTLKAATSFYALPSQKVIHLKGWAREQLTHWNQQGVNCYLTTDASSGRVYNYYTPSGYPCGCVATAGAAVLEFFQVPGGPTGITKLCKYNYNDAYYTTLGGSYDWSILPQWVSSQTTLDEAQRELLGRVTFDLGVLLGMEYTSAASASTTGDLAPIFRTYYGLGSARSAGNMAAEDYEALIYAQLWLGRPVILSIQGDAGGHAVVATGYGEDKDSVPYTHISMGYGRDGNGWFALPTIRNFTTVKGVVTMLGAADEPTVPIYGRVKTATGAPAAFVPVEACGRLTCTSILGTFALGVRADELPTPYTSLTVKVAGVDYQVLCGDLSEVADSGAYTLAANLPAKLEVTLPASVTPLTVSSQPAGAKSTANRGGKPILMLSGPCTSADFCEIQKALFEQAAQVNSQVVLCLSNAGAGYECFDDDEATLRLYDPRLFDSSENFEVNQPAQLAASLTAADVADLLAGAQVVTGSSCSDYVPYAWLQQHFGARPANSTLAKALADADSDGDGFTNAQEYILGTDPTDRESRFRFGPFRAQADGSLRPDYEQVSGRKYTLQGKATLADDWAEPDANSRFFRVQIALP
ncbi:MAG: C10 family peptidase [Candidatus Spyradenecus sp.]